MQKRHLVIGAALIVGSAATSLLIAGSVGHKSLILGDGKAAANDTESNVSVTAASAQAEIDRLRTELQRRDFALRTLAASSAKFEPAPGAAPAAEQPVSEQDPIVKACDVLDERLMMAPVDGRSTAELDRAVQGMLDASSIPRANVVSTQCGSTMCKVVLRDEDAKQLESNVIRMSGRTPKLFGANIVYSPRSNEKMLYFAKNGEDLSTEATGDSNGVPKSSQGH